MSRAFVKSNAWIEANRGRQDARADLESGYGHEATSWSDAELTAHLKITIGASDDYCIGYIDEFRTITASAPQ